jgi:2-dehydro-3-deoxygalactonokinase
MQKNDEFSLAIDGGTTNTRARLLRGDALVAAATRPVGVRDVAMTGSNEPLATALAECVTEIMRQASVRLDAISLVAASGMITSNVGLHEVSHVAAPAGIDDLARRVVAHRFPAIHDLTIHFVPGIKTMPAVSADHPASFQQLAHCDIMRGEETETFGILAATGLAGPLCLLLPGSHTKLVHVDSDSRITASFTTIAGELMQALAERTILSSSIDWPPPAGEPDWCAIDAGAEFARQHGLARAAFVVRLADLVARIDRAARTWFFVGLVIGSDWVELGRWSHASGGLRLLVGGREPLRSVYGRLASRAWRGEVELIDQPIVGVAAAIGAISIARRATHLGC